MPRAVLALAVLVGCRAPGSSEPPPGPAAVAEGAPVTVVVAPVTAVPSAADTRDAGLVDGVPAAASAFPPVWKLGDHWLAVMRTEAPHAQVAMRNPPKEPLRAVTYAFQVIAVPGAHGEVYRLEVRPISDDPAVAYTLEYRRDFSLARIVDRKDPGDAPRTVVENPDQPFVYDQRYHVMIVADFPFAPGGRAPAHHEIEIAHDHARLVQDVRVEPDHTHITLRELGPGGGLRVEIEWQPGRPWWSTIECTENGPPELHQTPGLVASGALAR